MSNIVTAPTPDSNTISRTVVVAPTFLLAPPPARKQRIAHRAPASPPNGTRRLRSATACSPTFSPRRRTSHRRPSARSPASAVQDSFLSFVDTPSTGSQKTLSPITPLELYLPGLHIGLGYADSFHPSNNFLLATPLPRNRRPARTPTVAKPPSVTPSKPSPTFVTKLAKRTRSIPNLRRFRRKPTSPTSPRRSPTSPRPRRSPRTPRSPPSMPSATSTRPTGLSFLKPSSKSKSSSKPASGSIAGKRYPLPLTYHQSAMLGQTLGESNAINGGAYTSGSSRTGKSGEVGYGGAMPYVGADGTLWRDRDEEFEYQALLERRGSAGSVPMHWQQFSRRPSRVGIDESDAESEESDDESVMSAGLMAGARMSVTGNGEMRYMPVFRPPGSSSRSAIPPASKSSRRRPAPLDLPTTSRRTAQTQPQSQPRDTRAAREDFLASSFDPVVPTLAVSYAHIPIPPIPSSPQPARSQRSRPPTTGPSSRSRSNTASGSSSHGGYTSGSGYTTGTTSVTSLSSGNGEAKEKTLVKKASKLNVGDMFKKGLRRV